MPPTRQPRTRGPKPTKMDPDQLLDAAQAVFAQEGLRAASLRAIARHAGCDPALIYYHFDSKEALFAALLARRFPRVLREMEQLADPGDLRPTAERLWAVLLVYHRHLRDDPGLRSMIRGEIVRGAEGLTDLIEARIRPIVMAVRAIFDQGIARGDLRPDLQPLLATFFLVRMQIEILDLLPALLPRLAGPASQLDLAGGMRAWFDLFWRGVARHPAVPLPPLPDPDH
ncbi:MAG: TetR/AcrR family transcriptional regulator [Geothrix sp.]|uniref:TetR/AcrR family transcriptional regulator n=1 Tax=Geothrix sp. TaxID=1962974 RepID=UPI001842213A|nr:TetR/AcrR family transcriptional regulator [Geothrix sp.]NWJ39764.1 TetR/AcrR family transcriptional regulator [Geothrix sp.]WIL22222.1 MAG: TetR/AcrR family transcriptional regulator [Geothrix sp.]